MKTSAKVQYKDVGKSANVNRVLREDKELSATHLTSIWLKICRKAKKKKKEEEMEKKKGETEAQYVAVLLFHNSSIHYLNFTSNSGLEPILAVVGWGGGVQPGHQSITGVFLL